MSDHFQGKKALQHVIEARLRGKAAAAEIHGTEIPGHYGAATDAAKETAFLLLVLFWFFGISIPLILGWLLWKGGRSALLGWSRIERLHRLIEEERWEIEHHRGQEKEELRALYAAKGFSGKLLDEAVEVLMADDNRLLQVMLEEELGLNLEQVEHPLKQACGAIIGVLIAAVLCFLASWLAPWTVLLTSAGIVAAASGIAARLEKNKPLPAMVWNLAIAAIATGAIYFLAQL